MQVGVATPYSSPAGTRHDRMMMQRHGQARRSWVMRSRVEDFFGGGGGGGTTLRLSC